MCDRDRWGCQFHNQASICDHNDHCHFEQYQHETRGPLHRTSTSTLRGCHRPNNTISHCCNSRSRGCRHDDRRNCCSSCQEHSILYDLENLLGPCRRNSDLANLLNRVYNTHNTHNDHNDHNNGDNRGILRQVLDELLGHNNNRNNNPPFSTRTTPSNTDRDVLVDLLLRITSSSSTNTLTTNHDNPPPYHPYYARRGVLDDLATNPHFNNLQQAWLARNATPIMPLPLPHPLPAMQDTSFPYMYSYPNLNVYGLGTIPMPLPIPTASTPWVNMYAYRGQVPPRWLGGGR
jgi:hypothetical protein